MNNDLTVSGTVTVTSDATVSIASAASQTLALRQGMTDILSWDTSGAVTLSSVANQPISIAPSDSSSGTSGAVSISGGGSGSSSGTAGAVSISGGSGSNGATGGALTLSGGAADVSGAVLLSSGAGSTTNGDVTIDSKTDTGTAGTITVQQGSDKLLVVDSSGAVSLNTGSGQDLTLSTGGAAAVTVDSSGNVGIGTASPAFELEVTGDIAQDGKKLHVNRRWEVDLTSQSKTSFYPVELKHSTPNLSVSTPVGEPITFKMFGAALVGTDSYNEVTLVGECRGGGESAHNEMCDVYKAHHDTAESRFLGVYASDNDYTSGFVIYTRGGYKYSVITDARDVVAHTSAYAATSSVTFAIKDSSGGDSSGTSSNTFQMIDLTTGAHLRQRIIYGDLTITGDLAKATNNFRIDHPLPSMRDTHLLYHSVIEGPRADNMYRGKSRLVNGRAIVNIDIAFNMTPGTFEALNRDIQCFTSNESGWEPVRGSVGGAVLVIESRDPTSVDVVSWMVIGERQDRHMFESTLTDENGRLIPEHRKSNAGS
jgi:hypothetical protein